MLSKITEIMTKVIGLIKYFIRQISYPETALTAGHKIPVNGAGIR